MISLAEIRKRRLSSFQLMLLAKQTGSALIAAEADAQAVRERLVKGPNRAEPKPERPIIYYSYPHAAPR